MYRERRKYIDEAVTALSRDLQDPLVMSRVSDVNFSPLEVRMFGSTPPELPQQPKGDLFTHISKSYSENAGNGIIAYALKPIALQLPPEKQQPYQVVQKERKRERKQRTRKGCIPVLGYGQVALSEEHLYPFIEPAVLHRASETVEPRWNLWIVNKHGELATATEAEWDAVTLQPKHPIAEWGKLTTVTNSEGKISHKLLEIPVLQAAQQWRKAS